MAIFTSFFWGGGGGGGREGSPGTSFRTDYPIFFTKDAVIGKICNPFQ